MKLLYNHWAQNGLAVRYTDAGAEVLQNANKLRKDNDFAIFACGHDCDSTELELESIVAEVAFTPQSTGVCIQGRVHPLSKHELANSFFVAASRNKPIDPNTIQPGDTVQVFKSLITFVGVAHQRNGELLIVEPHHEGPVAQAATTDQQALFFRAN